MRLGQKAREGWAGMETDRDGDSWRQGQGRGCRQEQRQGQRLRWRQTPILMRKNFRELCGLIIHGTKDGDGDGGWRQGQRQTGTETETEIKRQSLTRIDHPWN